jgi:hypothetical protein
VFLNFGKQNFGKCCLVARGASKVFQVAFFYSKIKKIRPLVKKTRALYRKKPFSFFARVGFKIVGVAQLFLIFGLLFWLMFWGIHTLNLYQLVAYAVAVERGQSFSFEAEYLARLGAWWYFLFSPCPK